MLLVTPPPCAQACRDILYRTRQAHRALGRDRGRVQRLWILPAAAQAPELGEVLARHPGLRLARVPSPWLAALPQPAGRGSRAAIYVVDPRARVMMAYPHGAPAQAILEDLERLLRASRTG